MIQFSINQPERRKQYVSRIGAYAIIKSADGLIAIVKTVKGYFLPGGGVEGNESLEACLKRECLEEIGAQISVLDNFACGNYYFYSTTLNTDMESIGNFFICKIDKFLETKTDPDHELIWLPTEKAAQVLYLENQKKAVSLFNNF